MADETGKHIVLKGRVFVELDIRAVTGLHIGGSDTKTEIGGVDKPIIRDPLSNRPYIPGSSLRGKMRSLTEKYRNLTQNYPRNKKSMHSCTKEPEYLTCSLCRVYGVPGEWDFATPTRLIVRDVALTEESAQRLTDAQTDLPYSEIKTEVSIDRVTAKANPRQMERVPAGAVFGPAQLVYSIYSGDKCDADQDVKDFATVLRGLQLLEDDYLGGLGSRGSGKVAFEGIRIGVKDYKDHAPAPSWLAEAKTLPELLEGQDRLIDDIKARLLGR